MIGLLWGLIYFAGMFTPALLDDVDTIHAEAAREMLVRHDWVTMYTNGIRYLEKAPLMYWSLASSYTLFGISDWSTRLPLMLGVLALLFATYRLGRYAYGELGGLYAGVVLATSIGPYVFTRFLIPDVLVGLWLTIGYLFFLRSLEEDHPSRATCWGFAAVCALNVLTKGLIGLVFPVGAIGLYLLLTGNLRHLLKLRIVSSTLVFLAIAAPWHILAAIRNPTQGSVRGFLWFYFVNEHLMRFLNKRVPAGYDTVPLLIFWGLLLAWLLPWAAFLPQSLREVPLKLRALRGNLSRAQRANLLFFLWALVIVGFFSFSTRQEYYTIPALPGLALLVGGWLARESTSDEASPDSPIGKNLVNGAICVRSAGIRRRHVPAFGLAPAIAGSRPGRAVEKESAGLRSVLGACAGLDPACARRFPGTVAGSFPGVVAGHGVELDIAAPRASGAGKHGTGHHDGRTFRLRSFVVQYIFADFVFLQACGGNPALLPAGRCHRRRWPIPPGIDLELLYGISAARSARAERQPLVWIEISGCSPCVRDARVVCHFVERPDARVCVDRSGILRKNCRASQRSC